MLLNSRRRGAILVLFFLTALLAVGSWAAGNPLALSREGRRLSLRLDGAHFVPGERVTRQRTYNECGPAALSDLLRLWGVRPPALDTLAAAAGLTARGTALAGLASAARRVGLAVAVVRVASRRAESVRAPFLAWMDRSHFVVVTGRTANGSVVILDPLAGAYTLPSERFSRRWSGESLVVLAAGETGSGLAEHAVRVAGVR